MATDPWKIDDLQPGDLLMPVDEGPYRVVWTTTYGQQVTVLAEELGSKRAVTLQLPTGTEVPFTCGRQLKLELRDGEFHIVDKVVGDLREKLKDEATTQTPPEN